MLRREFASGNLEEEDVDNCDETHFVENMENWRTLGFKGEENVKCADVMSGGGSR